MTTRDRGSLAAVWWMAGVSVASGILVAIVDAGSSVPVWFGLLGPSAAASGSWIATARTHARSPERVTARLIQAFAAKLVFFAVYVVVMLGVVRLAPAPFLVSFTASFLAWHAVEAVWLSRLRAPVS